MEARTTAARDMQSLERLDDAPVGAGEGLRALVAASPSAPREELDLPTMLSRLAGIETPQALAALLLAYFQTHYGEPIGVQIWLDGAHPEALSAPTPPPEQAQCPHVVQWTEGERLLGRLTLTGTSPAACEEVNRLAPLLEPTFRRLTDARARQAREQAERRQARRWEIQASMLTLTQAPLTEERYWRQALQMLQQLFAAQQVVLWTPQDKDMAPRFMADVSEEQAVAVPQALFQEAIDTSQVKTAVANAGGELQLFLLGPVVVGDRLEGVVQIVLPTHTMRADSEEELAEAIRALTLGLETVRRYEQLSFQASHDPLTGLANRRSFQQFVERQFKLAQRHRTPVSVLMVDVDHFKAYNDTYGHPAGDDLLKAFADSLTHNVRSTDFVARFGGEEFVIVLPYTGADGAHAAAEKILAGVRELHAHNAVLSDRVTASIGVATCDGTPCEFEDLLQRADTALYQAKRQGRDQVC